ncbi:MAG: homoserine kinase [Chloroflexi bacterium]|jgi:homoserine kinase|nr:homoserine kinase [Chloroflexota bacterium]
MMRLPELDGRRVVVEVPATSANLGAGYDVLAVALELPLRVEVEAIARPGAGVELGVEGEGAGELPADRSNVFVVALERALVDARGPGAADDLGWRVRMTNRIPLARGLGSSAAANVAGLLAGHALLDPEGTARPPVESLLAQAAELEGHLDNAAAALLGGFALAVPGEGPGDPPVALRIEAPRDLRAVLFIPDTRAATSEMRALLPAAVPLADAVVNLGHVALGIAGLVAGRADLLRRLTVDRLHEPYRAAAFPALPRLVSAARDAGALGACLSGSGSTVIAFVDSLTVITRVEAAFRAAAADLDQPGRVELVAIQATGARVVSVD